MKITISDTREPSKIKITDATSVVSKMAVVKVVSVAPPGTQGIQGLRGFQGIQGIQGNASVNVDGGNAVSVYGGTYPIDGGHA